MESNTFFSGKDIIYYQSAIKQIKKSNEPLRPLFEAFSNAWESFDNSSMLDKHINITLEVRDVGLGDGNAYTFEKLIVQDDGCGFDEENFRRFKCLHDNTKGVKNKSAGRIQYIHFFDKADFKSVFKEGDAFLKERLRCQDQSLF